jgi:alkylation response protein AidB-like acyl-CoA dehydrogenase
MESVVSLSNTASNVSANCNTPNKNTAITARKAQIRGLVVFLKVVARRALEQAFRETQQIMGGLGYSRTGKGARIEQISRDVRAMVVGDGKLARRC